MPNPTMSAEMELLKQAYAALNRNDIPGFVAIFDPHVAREEFPGTPMFSTVRGIEAMVNHCKTSRDKWAEGTCQPQRFITAPDKVIVIAKVHVRLKSETTFREGTVADLFVFCNGKVVQFNSYQTERQATEQTGIHDDKNSR